MNKRKSSGNFIKTTAIGGLLFLLPLIVLGSLIGQLVPIVMSIANVLGDVLPGTFKTPSGISLLVLLAIVVLLLLCFLAGLIARYSLGRRFSEAFEKKLVMLFPRYAILKDQVADSIGGDQSRPKMTPVLVRLNDFMRIGFEIERSADSKHVTVYLPGSPDTWSGYSVIVSPDRIEPLNLEFGDAVSICEQLGKGSTQICTSVSI